MTKFVTRVRSDGNGAGSRNSNWTWEVVDPGPPIVCIASGEATGAESRAYEAASAAIERHREIERRRTVRPPKRPRDTNQLAKAIVDIATGEAEDNPKILTDAQRLAQVGGLKGGPARRDALSPERRAEIARKAAKARWEPSQT